MSEALRLAEVLDSVVGGALCNRAAAELRRQHAEIERLRADAERYQWLRDHPLWSVGYRVKPRSDIKEWRMRDEDEYWGQWWPTHEQAIDAARAALKEANHE